ncbi:SDR family oxidoreductase [Hyphomonas sp.]|uniref:SDR family oxidoreductase n=1 Tax=Hyphomonas sp. TaxID=87 RepID=UPI0025BD27FC|nr:SDR family oxidoreductase [Hyphomonas sp.]MBI1399853.1 NAD(P)H-binding protein [Hyphomonas sp.]
MKVLVLGGYGLIGTAITRKLLRVGHAVTGLGRSARKGRMAAPAADWIEADLSRLLTTDDWRALLSGFDAVINASGALQDGLRDRVAAVQSQSIQALIGACEQAGVRTFVQISAPGAGPEADTAFFRTKGEADRALKASGLRWVIFRPGLVLSPHAYGGTALLRQLAAFPLVQPLVLAGSRIQTVHVNDVAQAVSLALEQDLTAIDADLVEPEAHRLEDLVARVRLWLGFRPARAVLKLPVWAGRTLSLFADIGGWLGWRSPLQSTALKVLQSDVRGDPTVWEAASGQGLRGLDASLQDLHSTLQERIYARAMLVFPVLLLTLSLFWVLSGVIGLVRSETALAVLDGALPAPLAGAAVIGGGLADCAIGAALLFRPFTRLACAAAIGLSAAYLAGATLFVPDLWLDPLGPMVKVLPAMALALVTAALTEER